MKKEMRYFKAMDAVVRIHVKGISDVNPRATLDPRMVTHEDWVGSGFFIKVNQEEGYILTNGHVTKNALHFEIRSVLTSDEPFKVELVGMVESLEPDVGLLKLSKEELARFKKISKLKIIPTLTFADSEKIGRSEEIKAIGFPLGMTEPNMTGGEITNFISGSIDSVERFVTDAAISPGNSGGPAILKNSKVVGLNTAIILGASNIAFITPIHVVKNILPQLLKGQDVNISCFGAYLQKNSPMNSLFLKHKEVKGMIINKIFKNLLAHRAGLKTNDLLLAVNGHILDRHGNVEGSKISRKKNLFDIIHSCGHGEKIQFKVFRSGKIKLCSTTIKYSKDDIVPFVPILNKRKNTYFEGLVLQDVCSEILSAIEDIFEVSGSALYRDHIESNSKIIVTAIDEESQGSELDFHIGDYVTHVNQQKVKSISQFMSAINKLIKTRSQILLKTSSGAIGLFEFNTNSK